MPDRNIFLWIAMSAVDAATVSSKGIKTLLADDLSTLFIKSKPVFSNGPKILPRNPPDCPILCKWFFDNFMLGYKPFAKALRRFETCVFVNKKLCGKLFSSLELPTSYFNNIFLYGCYIKIKHVYNTFTIPCEKSKTVSSAPSVMKNIVVLLFISRPWLSLLFRFPAKITCCIAFGPESSCFCLLKSIAIIL